MADIDMEVVIRMVECRPVLWDRTSECYKSRQSSMTAWREICKAINSNFESLTEEEKNDFCKLVIKKWNNTRDNWMKYHKIVVEGQAAKKIRKYRYYDDMIFLRKIVSKNNGMMIKSVKTEKNTSCDEDDTLIEINVEPSTSYSTDNMTPAKKIKTERIENSHIEQHQQDPLMFMLPHDNTNSRSMCFFKGIAPIIDKYSDEDFIEFQYEVTKLMRTIAQKNQWSVPAENSD